MRQLTKKILLRMLALPIAIYLLCFLPAGTFDYWQAYVYWGIVLVPMLAAGAYFLKHDPALMERRLKTREQESEQKVLVKLMSVVVLLIYLIPGFDKRFGWSEISVELVLLADGLVLAGYLFMMYVFKANSYAARTIEVEKDQPLIDTGPYAVVRHPMYSGGVLLYLGTPVALGSWWGLLVAATIPVLLAARLLNEEKVLHEELAGYSEYCKRVRWRLMPWVW